MTTHVAVAPGFADLVDLWAPVRQLGTGFEFTEGPIWHPKEQFLLFSDMPGDVRRRWDRTGVREVMRPANKCNGMTYDGDLNLIVCEHATSTLVRERPDGRREVLASHFDGRELNSPNDVVVKSDGAIYFSDPWYGRMPVYGVERPRQLGFQGVYRLPPGGGAPELVVDRTMFDQPNGLCFSPDERVLYVNDTVQHLIRAFDVLPNGRLGMSRVFASGIVSPSEPGVPDGMKCDSAGNVWVCGPGGVWVFAPHGALIGKLRVPELVGNLTWGGEGFRTSSSPRPIRSTRSRRRSGRGSSPTCGMRPAPPDGRSRRRRPLRSRATARRKRRAASRSIRRAARSSSRTCRTTW